MSAAMAIRGGVMRMGGKPDASTPGVGQEIKERGAQVRPVDGLHVGLWRNAARSE